MSDRTAESMHRTRETDHAESTVSQPVNELRVADTASTIGVDTVDRLASLNIQLSRLLHHPPATLSDSGQRNLSDSLAICGILGGKDVGKSTLIDALAGAAVSRQEDQAEAGAGTSKPRAYVHVSAVGAVKARLASGMGRSATGFDVEVTTHEVDSIRDTVLVDFPDFDSDFPQHSAIVREAAPHLDRLIWVITPRKIADREWVALFHDVVKDARNVHCVLNKMDEVVAEELSVSQTVGQNGDPQVAAEEFWNAHLDWAQQLIAAADCGQRSDGVFLLAAQYPDASTFTRRVAGMWDDPDWSRYANDREVVSVLGGMASTELDRLRSRVLGGISADEIGALKQANRIVEISHAVDMLQRHYDITRWQARLESACSPDACQPWVNEVFGPQYCEAVASRLAATRRSDGALADELFEWRVERWPILRTVYYPLSWLVRRLGRMGGPRTAEPRSVAVDSSRSPFDVGSRTLTDRCRLLVSRFQAEHGRLLNRLGLLERLPDPVDLSDRCAIRLRQTQEDSHRQLIDALRDGSRKPGWMARALLVGALVWFPFGQPMAEGTLEILGGTAPSVIHGLLTLVRALSAGQLLMGFLVVLGIYVACLAVMYARCMREVRRYHSSEPAIQRAADFSPRGLEPPAHGKEPPARGNAPATHSGSLPSGESGDAVDRLLMQEGVGPVVESVVEVRDELAAIAAELSVLRQASTPDGPGIADRGLSNE